MTTMQPKKFLLTFMLSLIVMSALATPTTAACSFAEQFKFGMDALRRFGYTAP